MDVIGQFAIVELQTSPKLWKRSSLEAFRRPWPHSSSNDLNGDKERRPRRSGICKVFCTRGF